MFDDVHTMCWSIKEVNRNLSDRKSVSDYSVTYLKKACSDLAKEIRVISKSRPGEKIEVVDRAGVKRYLDLKDVSEMLYDARKIVELNLIDHIDSWAKSR
ncbi:MAG: hypothetical protein HPY61_04275 [Methanotrichaceae archaeon]|nr:hypothetical protein [Methanotrichaceae archaeon]